MGLGSIGYFVVYVMAMLGVIGLALFVYKKFNMSSFRSQRTGRLNVEEALNLSPRKALYIIKADNERFLIAADMERTTLISRLGNNENQKPIADFMQNEDILLAEKSKSVMKNLVNELERKV